MTRILVQDDGHMPAPIMPVNQLQEFLEVLSPVSFLFQEQAASRVDVDRSEDDSLGISPANGHRSRLAPQGPCCPQRREQKQVSLILEEDNPTRPQVFKPPANVSFFSPCLGRGVVRSESVSRRSPVHATADESYPQKANVHPMWPIVGAATARSNSLPGNPIPWAIHAKAFPRALE